jgi:peptide/nickel transport system permease protein
VALLSLWVAVTLSFALLRLMPGDAITSQLIRGGASQDAIERERAALGLDRTPIAQYGLYMSNLVQGDLGRSLLNGLPVHDLLIDQLGSTAVLAFSALGIAIIIGLGAGTLSTLDSRPILSAPATAITSLAVSTPIYWTATLAIYIFASALDWLPATGSGDFAHLILPAAVLGFHVSGPISRVTHASIESVRAAPHVITARGKGLPEWAVYLRHILRVSLLPSVRVIALQAGFLISGTVITETIFARPGLGRLLLNATVNQDYPIVQGVVAVSTMTYVGFNLCVDFITPLLDPRLAEQ